MIARFAETENPEFLGKTGKNPAATFERLASDRKISATSKPMR
jgi:hypothetical protein